MTVVISSDQLRYIEKFYAKIRKGLDKSDFNVKRQIIQLLDIRGKIAYENGERVLYLKCLIEPRDPQAVSRVPISLWRCNPKGTQYLVSARLVLPKYGGRKASNSEYEDASAFAEASCLVIAG